MTWTYPNKNSTSWNPASSKSSTTWNDVNKFSVDLFITTPDGSFILVGQNSDLDLAYQIATSWTYPNKD